MKHHPALSVHMYRENTEEKDAAFLKLYDGHDWKWFAVRLKHTDMEYLRKHWSGKKASAPMLEKKHDKYFLRFTYAEEVSLNRTPVKEQTTPLKTVTTVTTVTL